MIPGCKQLYDNPVLDRGFVSGTLGISEDELVDNLHTIKRRLGLRGRSVWICLDDGEVYDPISKDPIGNVYDG